LLSKQAVRINDGKYGHWREGNLGVPHISPPLRDVGKPIPNSIHSHVSQTRRDMGHPASGIIIANHAKARHRGID